MGRQQRLVLLWKLPLKEWTFPYLENQPKEQQKMSQDEILVVACKQMCPIFVCNKGEMSLRNLLWLSITIQPPKTPTMSAKMRFWSLTRLL